MEISVITTKRKLTQSMIKQMGSANKADINLAAQNPENILGYVTLVDSKIGGNYAIIKGVTDYKVLFMYPFTKSDGWKDVPNGCGPHGYDRVPEYKLVQRLPKATLYITCLDSEDREIYLNNVNTILRFAKNNHIYL